MWRNCQWGSLSKPIRAKKGSPWRITQPLLASRSMLTSLFLSLVLGLNSFAGEWSALAFIGMSKTKKKVPVNLAYRYSSIEIDGNSFYRPEFAMIEGKNAYPIGTEVFEPFSKEKRHLLITLSPSQEFGEAIPEIDALPNDAPHTVTRRKYANSIAGRFQWLGLSWAEGLKQDLSSLKPDLSIVVSSAGDVRIATAAATGLMRNAADLFVGSDIEVEKTFQLPNLRILQTKGATPDSFAHFILTDAGELVEIGWVNRERPDAETVHLQASLANQPRSALSLIQINAFERVKPVGFSTPSKVIDLQRIDPQDVTPILQVDYQAPEVLTNLLHAIEAETLSNLITQLNKIVTDIANLTEESKDWNPRVPLVAKALELQLRITFLNISSELNFDPTDFSYLVKALSQNGALSGDEETRAARFKDLLDRVGNRILTDAMAFGWNASAGSNQFRLFTPCATLVNADSEPALIEALLEKLKAS